MTCLSRAMISTLSSKALFSNLLQKKDTVVQQHGLIERKRVKVTYLILSSRDAEVSFKYRIVVWRPCKKYSEVFEDVFLAAYSKKNAKLEVPLDLPLAAVLFSYETRQLCPCEAHTVASILPILFRCPIFVPPCKKVNVVNHAT